MQESFDAPLAPLTTMRVGGPARRLVTVEGMDDLVDAVRATDDADEPLLVLGGGSNVVVADAGFPGTVVHVATRGIRVESRDACSGVTVRIAAGEAWDAVVAQAVADGWVGIEALSGIPGSVGATPVQNVGAYGQEIADTLAQVRVWDRRRAVVRTLAAAECAFGYRDSLLKRSAGRFVVLEVVLQLREGTLSTPLRYGDLASSVGVAEDGRAPLADVRAAVLAQRRRRGMVLDPDDHDTWSCGSFFTNPVLPSDEGDRLRARVAARIGTEAAAGMPSWPAPDGGVKLSAAWLIERAGFGRGFGLPGPAALSTTHTLAVTNRGEARAHDVLELARTVRDGVADAYGVVLVAEPVLVGVTL